MISQRFSYLIVIAALVTSSAILGCGSSEDAGSAASAAPVSESQRRLVRVETRTITPGEFTDVIELTGSVEANDDATLSAQTAGTIRYLLPLGATVQRGATIARIDAGLTGAAVEQAEAQVASATATLKLARETYERQEPLYRDSVISALEFESVVAQFNQAQAQLQQAEGLLRQAREQDGFTRITAPFSGRIEQHFLEVGEVAAPGLPVIRIVNTRTVKITTGVPERYAGDIGEGSDIEVLFSSYGIEAVPGKVSFAGSVIDRASRTFPIEVQVSNREGKLKPEMIGKVLLTRDQLQDVLVVPLDAVIRDENGTNVFVAVEDGEHEVATRRSVIVGPTYSGQIVITEGLQEGEKLIVAGQNLLTPGDRLDVINTDNASNETTPARVTADS
ncbi:MAG: efflux RND transporter periplasmic adaptor subunit [Rhodothermales bacterium]|nr:efflux RND transporter periplasmic adaptor subunit [Rhodothermales bacterium]